MTELLVILLQNILNDDNDKSKIFSRYLKHWRTRENFGSGSLQTTTDWKLLSTTKNVFHVRDSHPFHKIGCYESKVTHLKGLGPNMLSLVGERVQNLRFPGESGYQTNESGPVPGKLLILRAGNRVPN